MSAIKTMINLAFFGVALDATALENLAKYDFVLFNFATEILVTPASVAPPVDWSGKVVTPYLAPLRAANPDGKIGFYIAGAVAFNRPWDPGWMFTASDQRLHKPDGTPLVYNDGSHDIYTWVDYGRDGVRSDHLAQYRAFMELYDVDALFLDSWLPLFYAVSITSLQFTLTGGLLEGPYHTVTPWLDWLPTWTGELTAGLAEDGREVWANGIIPDASYDATDAQDAFMGQYQENIVRYATGALMEVSYQTYGGVAEFPRYLAAVRATQELEGGVLFLTLPWLWTLGGTQPEGGIPDDTIPDGPDEVALRRYYLAVYLLIQDEQSYFGHQPYLHQAYYGVDGSNNPRVYWSTDYEIDYGEPAGTFWTDGIIYWRQYSRGIAAVVPGGTGAAFTVPGTYRVWGEGPDITIGPGDSDDSTVTAINIPGRSGYWLEFGEAA